MMVIIDIVKIDVVKNGLIGVMLPLKCHRCTLHTHTASKSLDDSYTAGKSTK